MSTIQYQTWLVTSLVSSIYQLHTSNHRHVVQLKALLCHFPYSIAIYRPQRAECPWTRHLSVWFPLSSYVISGDLKSGLPASNAIRLGAHHSCWLTPSGRKLMSALDPWVHLSQKTQDLKLGKKILKASSEHICLFPTPQSTVLWPGLLTADFLGQETYLGWCQ